MPTTRRHLSIGLACLSFSLVFLEKQLYAVAAPAQNSNSSLSIEVVLSNLNNVLGAIAALLAILSIAFTFFLTAIVDPRIASKVRSSEKRWEKRAGRLERRMGQLATSAGVDMSTFAFNEEEEEEA